MAENPESLISAINAPSSNNSNNNADGAADAMRRQIQLHEQVDGNKTALDKLVEVVWDKDGQSLSDLKNLQTQVDQVAKGGSNIERSLLTNQIVDATKADQSALATQNSVDFYAGSFLKAVPLFAGRNNLLMAASIAFNALDSVHMNDSGTQVVADLALGGLKGFALKKTFDLLGSPQLSAGGEGTALSTATTYLGVGTKGVAIGGLSRLYDTGLNRSSWVNDQGQLDAGKAISLAARSTFDWHSMALDGAMFMGGHAVFTGLAAVGTKALESSATLQKLEATPLGSFIKDSKMLPSSAMGATFGFTSGSVGEYSRERQSGESFDLDKILKRGALQGLTDAAAGATGAAATRLPEASFRTVPAERVDKNVQGQFAFAGDDAPPGGTVPPKIETAPAAGDANVPPAVPKIEKVDEAAAAAKPHVLDQAFEPIFKQAVTLATTAVQADASSSDVINFFKYAAGEGQHVKANMGDVAEQAKQYGNVGMETLIRRAYETTPETAATLDDGLRLAEAASRHSATPEQMREFFDYAYGPGKDAEIPLRIAAELSGNNVLDKRLQEAYAGVNQLELRNARIQPLILDGVPKQATDLLGGILSVLPSNGETHALFRQNVHTWLDLFPEHENVLHQVANQTGRGVVAAVVDAKLNTDYLSRFPGRSITSGDLLGRLRDLDEHRGFAPEPAAGSDNNPQPPVEQQPRANPYEPAVSHMGDKKVVNPQQLFQEFSDMTGTFKQARAYLLTDFIGHMSDEQFGQWYANGLNVSDRPGAPAGTTNFALMRMPGLDVLERPEVAAALRDPDHAAIDLHTLKTFLSAPAPDLTMPPAWQTDFIADRIQQTSLKQAMTPADPAAEGQPLDAFQLSNKIVRDALPAWFVKGLREKYSTYDRNSGQAIYPMEFDDNLAQMLENQRYVDRQNPKYRESTPPSNSFSDRIGLLERALDIQKVTSAPELIPQLLKLGANNQVAVRGLLDRLDPTTSAPEHTELLKMIVPKADPVTGIDELKTLNDAMFFGKKSAYSAFKAKQKDQPSASAERDRDNNLALALTVAQKIVPPADADSRRVQQIVSQVIYEKIRDPRPDRPDGPGGPGGPARGGPGGGSGKEFRQRQGQGRDERPSRQELAPTDVPAQTSNLTASVPSEKRAVAVPPADQAGGQSLSEPVEHARVFHMTDGSLASEPLPPEVVLDQVAPYETSDGHNISAATGGQSGPAKDGKVLEKDESQGDLFSNLAPATDATQVPTVPPEIASARVIGTVSTDLAAELEPVIGTDKANILPTAEQLAQLSIPTAAPQAPTESRPEATSKPVKATKNFGPDKAPGGGSYDDYDGGGRGKGKSDRSRQRGSDGHRQRGGANANWNRFLDGDD